MKWEEWASNLKSGDTAHATPGPFVVAEINEHCVVDTEGNEHSWHDVGPDGPASDSIFNRALKGCATLSEICEIVGAPVRLDQADKEWRDTVRDAVAKVVKERDFWAAEAARAFKARDEAQHDLRHARSGREQALHRAIADLALIWSRGVRP